VVFQGERKRPVWGGRHDGAILQEGGTSGGLKGLEGRKKFAGSGGRVLFRKKKSRRGGMIVLSEKCAGNERRWGRAEAA